MGSPSLSDRTLRVLLYDPVLDGHHWEYASFIGRFLMEHGDHVALGTQQVRDGDDQTHEGWADLRTVGPAVSDMDSMFQRQAKVAEALQEVGRWATAETFDVVHCLYLDRNELPVWRALARGGMKPWTVYGTLFWPYFLHRPETRIPLKSLYHRVNLWALTRMLKHGHLASLFVHAAGIRDLLLASMRGVPAQRVVEVPDPSEPPMPISQGEARRRLGLPMSATIALFFGTFRADKGPDIFLKALAEAPAEVVGVMAGSPGSFDFTELERLHSSLPDPNRAVFRAGWVSQEDMGAYFAAADVVVLPYRRAFQGTSGVLQRAAAYGKRVLATDVGQVGATVRANELGLVVEPESPPALTAALGRIAREAEVATHYAGREYARRSDWRVLGDRVRQTYLDELERRGL